VLETVCIYEASIFALPVVEDEFADALLAAHIGHFEFGVSFVEDRNGLGLGGFALLDRSMSDLPVRILSFLFRR
jgi:hypothetical protein